MLEQGPILVPLDGSELAEGALPYASALADKLRTHLVLLTVWEGGEADLASVSTLAVEMAQTAQTYFENYLEQIRERLQDDRIRAIVRSGDAAAEILKVASETSARAIVIATHGRSGISRWVYGSTAGHLLRHSSTPVLAIGPRVLEKQRPSPAFTRILVPLDGSPLSEQAIPVVMTLATAAKAQVALVRVVPWATQAYPYTLPDAYVPQLDTELEKGAQDYLRRHQDALKSDGDVEAFVVRGAIADGLLDFIDQHKIDLVVMTTHARKGLARAALGSVADRVLQGNAPVLLLKPNGS